MDRLVIVGAWLAGLRAAQAARAAGYEGELVLIGDEPHPPYTRPPLSKELLKGEQTAEHARALPGSTCSMPSGASASPATGLDADRHTGRPRPTAPTLRYDRLIVATGARRDVAAGPAPALPGVHTLRDLDDAAGPARCARRRRASGRSSARASSAARSPPAPARCGIEVALVDVAPHPLLPLGPELGARCAQLHREHGVELRLGAGIDAAARTEAGSTPGLTDGTEIPADLVLLAARAAAEHRVAGRQRDRARRGRWRRLRRDAHLRLRPRHARRRRHRLLAPSGRAGGERVRVEHWTTAAEHGRLAGANATKDPAERVAHVAPPYFWSDQYELKIQSVGFPARAARIEIVEDDETSSHAPRLLAEALGEDGELVGAVAFNNARRLAEYRRRLAVEYA